MSLLKTDIPQPTYKKDRKKYEVVEIQIAKNLDMVNGEAVCIFPFHEDWIDFVSGAEATISWIAQRIDPDHILGKRAWEFLHHDFIWNICGICHGFCTSGFKHPKLGDLNNNEVRYLGLVRLSGRDNFRHHRALDRIELKILPERIKILTQSKD